jgi:phospholipid/cholesterol/gamma-HCH transport system permease protein
MTPAALSRPSPQHLTLSGSWTAHGLGQGDDLLKQLAPAPRLARATPGAAAASTRLAADAAQIEALDTAGAWVLHQGLERLRAQGVEVALQGLRPDFAQLLALLDKPAADATPTQPPPGHTAARRGRVNRLGRRSIEALQHTADLLGFVGQTALALAGCFAHPSRWRWRAIAHNIRSAGVDALPIVGLLSFLLGVVVAYQAADQLRRYGANIFVADLVGLSMLREFAPLITAIIIAGRSGSAFAAQIGTMAVTEEIDALRTLGISPQELLVLPKIIALVITLPLLTVFADVLGVFGGMVMARAQLDVSFADFLDRFVKAVSITSYLTGIGKAPVFAAIIASVACYQGLRTRGGADSVGLQTTRSVVQSIFGVIVADALFSVAFSLLDL